MELLFDRVKTFCLAQGINKTYWIAYSGGVDSHVLLHVCAELRKHCSINLKAVYINHGLSPNASVWAAHCENVCRDLQIDFISASITITADQGDSPEAIAREFRYKTFAEYLGAGDVLLTAHHQDDQAETVLLQLMRGAGPKGLAAMPEIKSFAKGFHGRPLLNFSRNDLVQYAHHHGLQWIEDESNCNVNFSRNFLRHDIVPLLKKRWPSVTETLSRVALHCAETQTLVDEILNEHLQSVVCDKGISVSKLLSFSPVLQKHLLRHWLASLYFPIPSAVKMQQIQQTLLHAAEDKMPHIHWGDVELRRYKDVLYVMKRLPSHDDAKSYCWDFSVPLMLSNVGILKAETVLGQGLKKDIKQVTVRFRQGGESCRLAGREFRHDLKNLFQQWGVPPWMRGRIPLIFVEDTLVAVVGYFLDDNYAAKEGEDGWCIDSSI